MRTHICRLLLVLLLAAVSLAQAATLAIYPFESQDPLLGVAISERLAEAFASEFETYGPAVTPALIPPFTVEEGFFNPTAFLEQLADRTGVELVRSALGADNALTGSVDNVDGQLVLTLWLATPRFTDFFTVQADGNEPGRLVERAATALALRLGVSPAPEPRGVSLSAADATLFQAVGLLGAGLLADAAELLDSAAAEGELEPAALQLSAALTSVAEGSTDGDPALLATLSISRNPIDEELSLNYFTLFATESNLPAPLLWRAVLLASLEDAAAGDAFTQAAVYPYGAAAAAAEAGENPAAVAGDDLAALLIAAVHAQGQFDVAAEQQVWLQLTRAAPFFVYPFERLSFIAFEQDNALAAAQALAVAVQLEPGSDLYWTNLGWAYYLLGLLELSEEASIKATLLSPAQYIASYNLGLVRATTGRLADALAAYDEALHFSTIPDADAIEDLEEAVTRYKHEPALNFALAYLREAADERSDAARQYRRFLLRASRTNPYRQQAEARLVHLSAPPPEIQLPGATRLLLGRSDVTGQLLYPGDPLFPQFEVYTPGEVLPARLHVTLTLTAVSSGEEAFAVSSDVVVPPDAIGFVIDRLPLELPRDLPADEYRLGLVLAASEDRHAEAHIELIVGEGIVPLRRLLGYGIMMQGLEHDVPLYGAFDLAQPDQLFVVLQTELQAAAGVADEVLPAVARGRFSGLTGGAAFLATTEADLRDFVNYMASPELQDASFIFVEAYAQWVLDGAPTE